MKPNNFFCIWSYLDRRMLDKILYVFTNSPYPVVTRYRKINFETIALKVEYNGILKLFSKIKCIE